MRNWIACGIVAAFVLLVPACGTIDFGRAQDTASAYEDVLAAERAKWEAEYVEAANEGDEERALAAHEAIAAISKMQTQVGELVAEMSDYVNEDGTVDEQAVGMGVAGLVPPPWNVFVAAGIPLAWGAWERYSKTKRATELVAAVDAMKKENPIIADAMKDDATRTAMWEQMSPSTYRFVEDRRNT